MKMFLNLNVAVSLTLLGSADPAEKTTSVSPLRIEVPARDPTKIRFTPPAPLDHIPQIPIVSSTTTDHGSHWLTIARAEPSTLPDLPTQKAAAEGGGPYPLDIPEREYISNDNPKKLGFPIEDEDANPYEVIMKAGLSHGIGEITSFDAPIFMAFASDPSVGSSLAQVANFREFARLEIKDSIEKGLSDRFWYRISKYQKWHHVWSATYGEFPPGSGDLVWKNNSSSSGSSEFVIPNE